MKLYRAMTPDADGLPQVGRSARKLGVRAADQAPNNDVVAAASADTVRPGKGMSVAPADPVNLPKNRRPAAVNNGTGKDPVWEIDTDDLGPGLVAVAAGPPHHHVEPDREMTLAELQNLLAATRTRWVRV